MKGLGRTNLSTEVFFEKLKAVKGASVFNVFRAIRLLIRGTDGNIVHDYSFAAVLADVSRRQYNIIVGALRCQMYLKVPVKLFKIDIPNQCVFLWYSRRIRPFSSCCFLAEPN
jgi:hypothetical protein